MKKKDIKFRVFNRDTGKVHEVNMICGMPCIVWFGDDSGCSREDHLTYEEVYGEVMQYTGLKDKNGTDIYEGDIVEVIPTMMGTRYFKGVVKFEECAFYIVNEERQDAILLFDECEPRRIVGNIHEDSKDLLRYDVDKNM